MSGRVVVVGSINVDLVGRVERLPAIGETVTGATFERHPGGKGANQATAAARLGATVCFVGAVGRDPFADEAREALASEGVDVTELASLAGPTGVALILVDRMGENVIAVASGANAGLDPELVTAAIGRLTPGSDDIVLVGHEIPTPTARAALAAGRAAGARTVFNPAPAAGVDRALLGLVDILVPNRIELAQILAEDDRRTGRAGTDEHGTGDPRRAAGRLLESNSEGGGVAEAVVVTLGAGGAVLVRRATAPVDVGAPRVAAIDTVGAGDTFVGAIAAGLADGSTLDAAVRRAVVAAALSTTKRGARGGMPTSDELATALTGGG